MARPLRAFALFFLCLVALLAAPWVLAAPTAPKPKETVKYGIYLGSSRIGSMVTRTFDTTFDKKPAERLDADSVVQLEALGSKVEQKINMTYVLDKSGRPLSSRFVISSLGRDTIIDARYWPDRVVCTVDAAGQKSTKTVPIPKGVTLVGDPQLSAAKDQELKVGQKLVMHFFEPMTMTIQKVESEVLREGKRTVGGKEVPAFLLKTTNSLTGSSQTWVDARGNLLEDNSPGVGLRLVREDVSADPSASKYEPPKDFAVATAVKTAVRLPDPRKTNLLRLKISGIPDGELILSDIRQKVVSRDQGRDMITATYLVEARNLPSASLPAAAPGAKGAGLGDAPYLGVDDPAIRKQAKDVVGAERSRTAIARRLRAWVKGHMQKPNNVGTPRSAAEILRSRDGVCRDYATLFAALARAVGVPTRVCSGIVYFEDSFFYHAWVECQLTDGEDGWYPLDPTLDVDSVDATHLKFAHGDPADMFAAVRVVGQIQAEILEYK
jgi:transglutaminase-like putative cysteine protease